MNEFNIEIMEEYYGYDLITISMHPSEWSSILYNLYTNSKKAIIRSGVSKGKIKILGGRENDKIYIEFLDNGDGIPSQNINRIFDAFFTTSTPSILGVNSNESIIGTGLGLKIVKDIITSYNGKIEVIEPDNQFKTCFRIDLPEASILELEKYGI